MKAALNTKKKCWHVTLEVRMSNDRKFKSVEFLEDIRQIGLEEIGGRVYKHFKERLIEGSDTALLSVFEVGKDFYKFDLIVKADNVAELCTYAGIIARWSVDQNVEDQTVIPLVVNVNADEYKE